MKFRALIDEDPEWHIHFIPRFPMEEIRSYDNHEDHLVLNKRYRCHTQHCVQCIREEDAMIGTLL